MTLSIAYILFFFSGVCALMYEVTWFRLFDLYIGVSIYSATAVLTAFMVGLALGSRYIGKKADKLNNPLRVYGWLQIGIGLYCYILPYFARWICNLQAPLYEYMLTSRLLTTFVRFLIVLIVLLPATVAMGGTLPLLARFCSATSKRIGAHISLLYSVNTGGAALGAYIAGFHLIEALGVSTTALCASLLNLIVGLTALLLNKPVEFLAEREAEQGRTGVLSHSLVKLLLITTALCGFTSLGLEVCWNRFLPLIIGSSTYSFSLILSAFLCGIAAGSLAVSQCQWDVQDIPKSVGTLLFIVALAVGFSLPIFGNLPEWFVSLRQSIAVSFTSFLTIQFLGVFALFFIPTFCYGAAFPLIARGISSLGNIGEEVGRVYWWNTIGTVAGVILTGFVFIPLLGIKSSMVLLQTIAALCALTLLKNSSLEGRLFTAATVLVFVVIIGCSLLSTWDKRVLTAGVFRYWDSVKESVAAREKNSELLYYSETRSGVVSVQRYGKKLSLKVNGKPDASSGSDMVTQLLLAHIPLALAEKREDVLIIGVGSGVTAGACLPFNDVKTVDAIELLPTVTEASKLFKEQNGAYWLDERVTVYEEDGRNFVAFINKKYDVIVSEPSNPWFAGVGNLMTREAFLNFKALLKPNGLMVQHVHYYENSSETVNTILRTFRDIFPQCSIWQLSMGDMLVVGSRDGTPVSVEKIGQLFDNETVGQTLVKYGIGDRSVLYTLELVSNNDFDKYISQSVLNEDDYPIVEFLAPQHFYERSQARIDPLSWVFTNKQSLFNRTYPAGGVSASQWANIARHWREISTSAVAFSAYERALAKGGKDIKLLREFVEFLLRGKRWQRAYELANELHDLTSAEVDFLNCCKAAKELDLKTPSLEAPLSFQLFDSVLSKWKAKHPNSWEPFYAKGVAYRAFDSALSVNALEEAAKRVLKDEKASIVQKARVFLELGMSLQKNGKIKAAIAAYRSAMSSNVTSIKEAAQKELSTIKL